MPRLRFVAHAWRCKAAIAVAGITMLISLSAAASSLPKGERNLELTFQVVDADSGKPIAGAGGGGLPISR